ncbi:MAG: MBL fold metallo-hydrolase [Betaproteobacteria bacterium]|nr:MBL fold metallo-hydrolase [Betaproteobacteria bacterium]
MEDLGAIIPGVPARITPRVVRITAPNPGMMTGPGTNTYLVGDRELAVIDPGPESAAHAEAVLRAVGDRLRWILCTHTHLDHSPGTRALKQATGAQVLGMPPPPGRQDSAFAPDRVLGHGDIVSGGGFAIRALHTPGHASNHLCYLLAEERLLFTGDHIMQGSTVVISPPDGDMIAYLRSLEALLALDIARLAPGHGHPIDAPHAEVKRLIAHRLKREQKVLDALRSASPATLDDLLPVVYSDTSPRLHAVARRSLHAHLIKLACEGRVTERDGRWAMA